MKTLSLKSAPLALSFAGLAETMRLDALWSYLVGRRAPQKQPGAGVLRARMRLAQKRSANELIPSGYRNTRQQRRRVERLLAKQARTKAKMLAMKSKPHQLPGGAARIRTFDDALAFHKGEFA